MGAGRMSETPPAMPSHSPHLSLTGKAGTVTKA